MGDAVVGRRGFSSGFSTGFETTEIQILGHSLDIPVVVIQEGLGVDVSATSPLLLDSVLLNASAVINANVSADVLSLNSGLINVNVSTEVNIPVSALSLNSDLLAASATTDTFILPLEVGVDVTPESVNVITDANTSASSLSTSIDILPPVVSIDAVVTSDALRTSGGILPVTVAFDVLIPVETILTSAAVNDPFIATSQTVSASPLFLNATIPPVTLSFEGDWDSCVCMPNEYWDKDEACRQSERMLYTIIQNCAFTSFGVDLDYYVVDFNTMHDRIYGEDNDRHVDRYFKIKAYYDLPEDKNLWTQFGIESVDDFVMNANILHFEMASTYDYIVETSGTSGVYDSYVPQQGDVLKADYNPDLFYEIIEVKKTDNQFLQAQHSYEFTVRPFRDFRWTLTSATSATPISAVVDQPDILEVNDAVDDEKGDYIYDPFSGW